jgi:hypothetical protein
VRVLAITMSVSMIAAASWSEPCRATADDRPGAPTTASNSPVDVQKRVRELIYILRYHRWDVRTDEWGGAIRELVQIGQPAVPEIVAELDRTDRAVTVRGLVFALRSIGDPRAVAALIRALGKRDLESGSDYGVSVSDTELMAFMKKNQDYPDQDKNSFLYGRPINEISTALSKITKHPDPIALRGADRKRYWTEWWEAHRIDFPTDAALRSAQSGGSDQDLVEEAGIARFGAMFPTGKGVELGPVHEVELQFDGYVNARSYIDFDTGRLYQFQEGISADEAKAKDHGPVMRRWFRRSGVDAHCNASVTGDDLQLWLIDNARWDTLESEIRSGRPLNLGREATYFLVPFGRQNTDWRQNELGTFLFITREGGRGVIQTFPRENDATYSHRLRYRIWGEKQGHDPAPPVQKAPRDESEWGPERIGILRPPGRGQPFLMNLQTGKREVPPDSVVPANVSAGFLFAKDSALTGWCRTHGDDLGTMQILVAGEVKPAGSTELALVGLDMNALAVLPRSYEEMSLAELKDLIARYPPHTDQAWMLYHTEPRRDTYVFASKLGTLGLLQIKAIRDEEGGIVFRYRLAKRPSRKD